MTTATRPAKLNKRTLKCIPGYDPFATAGDCWFDKAAAQLACDFFFECLKHVKGELAGEPFVLERWQQAIVGNLFGWKRPDGTRRYRECMIEVPRKNGKTTLAAGIANYVLFCDGEPGAEIYCAAAARDQAALVYDQARGMVEQDEWLNNRSRIYSATKCIMLNDNLSFVRTISADASTKHGFNTHCAIIDELHAQPNRELVDAIDTSTGARRQPLILYITTSDFDRPSICNEKVDFACKVRDGIITDESYLPVIHAALLTDNWHSVKTWKKANPNYGVSIKADYLRRKHQKAIEEPTFENTFKRLHLNICTEQSVRWIQMDAWDACAAEINMDELSGAPCFGGLDLSNTTDLTSFALAFPNYPEKDHFTVLCWSWCPGENAHKRELRDRVPYITWNRLGHIEITEGNIIDYNVIRRRISGFPRDVPIADGEPEAFIDRFRVIDIGYDPWNARHLCEKQLYDEDGLEMVPFRQGYNSMNEPTKQLERLVIGGMLHHGGQAVMRWAASNVSVRTDPAGNLKPDKEKSSDKIDPIVATIIAIGRAIQHGEEKKGAYDEHDLIVM